jgi:cortexillin 1/2
MAHGVQDQSWQLVQEKAFTAWMNETLKPAGIKINDIREDLGDGLKLVQFFEVLAQKKINTRLETRITTRIQKIQNLHIALKFLETEMGVRNPGCSAENLADGAVNMVLGLLWTLYRKYRIATISVQDKSSEEGLLLWVKNVTDGYKGVNIENFKTSFKDGMAFLALVHRFNPDKTGVDFNSHNSSNPEHNLQVAFELAEQELGIPKLLDVKEVMTGHVDERSLVLYTSLFFHAYKAAAVAQGLEKERLSTEETLANEKKLNDDLRRENERLKVELRDLKIKFDELQKGNEEITLKFNKLSHETQEETLKMRKIVEEKQDENLQLKKGIQEQQDLAHKLNVELKDKTEKNLELRQMMEDERADLNSRLEELHRKNLELNEQLHAEQTRRQELESKVTDLSSSLNENQETNLQVITELRKKQAAYEDEIESLKNDVENFKAQLDNERRENNNHQKSLQEKNEQDSFHRKGLQVLRNNLEAHIKDLHIWQGYLDSKDREWLDFERDVKPMLSSELSAQKDFVEELNVLSDKLDQENELMLRILKAKAAEVKEAEKEKAEKAAKKK